jgi:hypothetical protein
MNQVVGPMFGFHEGGRMAFPPITRAVGLHNVKMVYFVRHAEVRVCKCLS